MELAGLLVALVSLVVSIWSARVSHQASQDAKSASDRTDAAETAQLRIQILQAHIGMKDVRIRIRASNRSRLPDGVEWAKVMEGRTAECPLVLDGNVNVQGLTSEEIECSGTRDGVKAFADAIVDGVKDTLLIVKTVRSATPFELVVIDDDEK